MNSVMLGLEGKVKGIRNSGVVRNIILTGSAVYIAALAACGGGSTVTNSTPVPTNIRPVATATANSTAQRQVESTPETNNQTDNTYTLETITDPTATPFPQNTALPPPDPTPTPASFLIDEVKYDGGIVSGNVVNTGSLGKLVMELHDPTNSANILVDEVTRELNPGETYAFRFDVSKLLPGKEYGLEIQTKNGSTGEETTFSAPRFYIPAPAELSIVQEEVDYNPDTQQLIVPLENIVKNKQEDGTARILNAKIYSLTQVPGRSFVLGEATDITIKPDSIENVLLEGTSLGQLDVGTHDGLAVIKYVDGFGNQVEVSQPFSFEVPYQMAEVATAQPLTYDISYSFGDRVPLGDQQKIIDAVDTGTKYAKSLGIPGIESPFTIYAIDDLGQLLETYSQIARVSLEAAHGHWDNGRSNSISGPGYMFINTSAPWWSSTATDTEREKVIIHEVIHHIQNDLSYTSTQADNDSVPLTGPRWLSEGFAEFNAYLAQVDNEVYTLNEALSILKNSGRNADTNLSTMETWKGFSTNRAPYPLSALATNFLTAETGVHTLLTYYRNLEKGTPWQTTFTQTFGITPEVFYTQFQTHRQAGFPKN